MAPKTRIFLAAFAVCLALDLASKLWIASSVGYGDRLTVIEGFFYITHVRNPGAAFSMFAESPEPFRRVFFVGMTALAIVLIVSFQRKLAPGERFPALALGMILGGASGNLIDRLFRSGEVLDFLHFRLWSGYSWPDFNFADSFIVVGVGLLVLELLASESESRVDPGADADPRGTDAEHA